MVMLSYGCSGEVLKILVNNSADINQTDAVYNETCLHKAVRMEAWENVKVLSKCHINANIQDVQGETALHKAASKSMDIFVWKILLTLGGNPNVKNDEGQSVFQKAYKAHNSIAMSMMKQYGYYSFH